jgi:prophage DNA circulation protein
MGSALRVIFQPHPEAANEASAPSDVSEAAYSPINETVNEVHEAVSGVYEAVSEVNATVNETVNEIIETVNETVDETGETVNETVNARQQWFIAQIIAGRQPGWADLVKQWQVSRATAMRDIAGLKARGLIEFVGAPKTGFYRLTKQG